MNCTDVERMLPGYLDGELDLAATLAVEGHLDECSRCSRQYGDDKGLRRRILAEAPYHRAPTGLEGRILRGLDRLDGKTRPSPGWRFWRPAGAIVSLAAVLLIAWLALPHQALVRGEASPWTGDKVVYQISNRGDEVNALRNIANYLDAAPKTRLVVVAYNSGIGFLLRGASGKDGTPYESEVAKLVARGVDFRICRNSLKAYGVPTGEVIRAAHLVPSGIAEIGRLEAREGYAYMKP